MRVRMIIAGLVAGVTGLAVPALASTDRPASPVPPACVVVTGPAGASLQVGYAPNGPGDCTALP